MIDWVGLITNSLWILGLAVVLSVLSAGYWSVGSSTGSKQRLRDVLRQPSFQMGLWIGLTLFCAGVALSGGRWWARVLWGVLAFIAAFEVWGARRAMHLSMSAPALAPDRTHLADQELTSGEPRDGK